METKNQRALGVMTADAKPRATGRGRAPGSKTALKAGRANRKPFKPGDPRVTKPKTEEHKMKISNTRRLQEAARRDPKIKRKAEVAAFDRAYRDALDILRAGEPEAAERIVRIIRNGKNSDALAASRELLNRTRGLPVAHEIHVVAQVDPQRMNLQQIEQELAKLGVQQPQALPAPDTED